MPTFSARSLAQLATCHPDLQVLFREVIRYWDCTILEGYRGKEAQEAAFAAGTTQLHYPRGKHNQQPSMAVDVTPYPIDWHDTSRFHLFAGFVLGVATQLRRHGMMDYGVRWGGDWNGDGLVRDETFRDLPHYELKE